jgi:hypothetical protein
VLAGLAGLTVDFDMSKPSELAFLWLIVVSCVLSSGCAKAPPPRVEEKPISPETLSTPDKAAPKSTPDLPAPEPAEVKGAIDRVFKGAVTITTNRTPYSVAGDFNGDSSQDLAVAVRPTPGKLLEINDELAPWIVVDPVKTARPSPKGAPYPELHAEMAKRRRALVDEGDNLLAVIHGFQSKGWRDSQATQTYVLKDAAGARMEAQARNQIVWAGNEERLPRIRGDVIAQFINERQGFLYYNGAKYAWYDPRSYKPEPPARIIHGGGAKATRR